MINIHRQLRDAKNPATQKVKFCVKYFIKDSVTDRYYDEHGVSFHENDKGDACCFFVAPAADTMRKSIEMVTGRACYVSGEMV